MDIWEYLLALYTFQNCRWSQAIKSILLFVFWQIKRCSAVHFNLLSSFELAIKHSKIVQRKEQTSALCGCIALEGICSKGTVGGHVTFKQ